MNYLILLDGQYVKMIAISYLMSFPLNEERNLTFVAAERFHICVAYLIRNGCC